MGDVIDFKSKTESKDPIWFLEQLLAGMKDGTIPPIQTAVLTFLHTDDSMGTFGFGPVNDDMNVLGVMRCAEHSLLTEICGV